jgi:CRP/FNR family cyclic AMP-dependent transcriptional regulator
MVETLDPLISGHPFFASLDVRHMPLLTACATRVQFDSGTYIFREGEAANHFYLIKQGKVAVEIPAPPRKPIIVQTLEGGEVLGWSWLVPPYQWRFHARAVEPVVAFALDGKCLRKHCEENHDLGYELLKRFTQVITQRLEATRYQLLDVYAPNK